MLKKKFICLGLSMIMLFTSIINTPAAVTAGQYYKIKYTHNKKTVTKRAIDARYNNKVIKTNIPGYIEGSISMYSAYWIFGRCSSISTKYSYSSKTKKITLTRGSQKISFNVKQHSCNDQWKENHSSICPKEGILSCT